MATILPSGTEVVNYRPKPVSQPEQKESAYCSLCGVGGPDDGIEARTHQLSLLVEVNAALAGALDVESVLGDILARLADRERLSHARIYRLDESAEELQPVASGGRNGEPSVVVSLRKPTLLTWAIRHREAVYVPHANRDPRCETVGAEDQCAYAVPSRPTRACWAFSMSRPTRRTASGLSPGS